MSIDETRLDLHAADQERLEQWREAYRESRRTLDSVMRSGVAMYPMVGRRGTIYRSSRTPATQELPAAQISERDEEIKMPESGRTQRPTYEEALGQAIAHAQVAQQYAGSSRTDYLEKAEANALTSRAWSALAGLIRADEVRAGTEAYMQTLRDLGQSPTGRKRDYVRVPSPEAQRLVAEAAQTELPKGDA